MPCVSLQRKLPKFQEEPSDLEIFSKVVFSEKTQADFIVPLVQIFW